MFSTVICRGNSGFFNSCARRLASSRQAATRSACTRRSRCATSSPVMRLKARARVPISSAEETSTVVFQSPAATRPALSARRCMGRVTRAAAHQLRRMPSRMPAPATITPVRSREFSSSTRSRRELPISRTPSMLLSSPGSGTAWTLSAAAPEPTMRELSRRSDCTARSTGARWRDWARDRRRRSIPTG